MEGAEPDGEERTFCDKINQTKTTTENKTINHRINVSSVEGGVALRRDRHHTGRDVVIWKQHTVGGAHVLHEQSAAILPTADGQDVLSQSLLRLMHRLELLHLQTALIVGKVIRLAALLLIGLGSG